MLLSMERDQKESRHGKKFISFFLSLAIIFSVAGFATYAEDKIMIFVSPNGNDNSSGTIDAPPRNTFRCQGKGKST